jgi:hypothetical protein
MEINKFFFRLYAIDQQGVADFLGTSFPVTPDGGLLTCRHVADIDRERFRLAVHDNETSQRCFLEDIRFPSTEELDMAFLPRALPGTRRSFFPILTPSKLITGEDVYSYGFFALAGDDRLVEQGYFSGRIVNFTKSTSSPPVWSLTLPFPVLEGMSGSPVLTYHNGPKVVGLAFGNRSTRILASEILAYEDANERFTETVHRLVEFGLAYHCNEIVRFLGELEEVEYCVADRRIDMPGF